MTAKLDGSGELMQTPFLNTPPWPREDADFPGTRSLAISDAWHQAYQDDAPPEFSSKVTFSAPSPSPTPSRQRSRPARPEKPAARTVAAGDGYVSTTGKRPAAGQSNPTVRASALSQPCIRHLPINLDALRWNGRLPSPNNPAARTGSEGAHFADLILNNPDRRALKIGPFDLVPVGKVWSWRIAYDVHAPTKSDPIARLLTYHEHKRTDEVQIDAYSEAMYHGDGLTLCADFWELLEVTNEGLHYAELKGFSHQLAAVPGWIKATGAVKKNAKPASRTKNGLPTVQIGSIATNGPGQTIDPEGQPERMTVGHQSSSRRLSVYPFGRNAKARGKAHQIQFIKDNNGVPQGAPIATAYAIEARINHKEWHRCLIPDPAAEGGQRPIRTLREWDNLENVKAVLRTQIETGFDFRVPDPAKPGKMLDVSFFDWDAIGAARLTRTPRRKCIRYSAKQAVKRLEMDGREGDYLVKGLKQDLPPIIARRISTPANADLLTDTLDNATDPNQRQAIALHWLDRVAAEAADTIAPSIPPLVASRMAAEYGVQEFHRKVRRQARQLPPVDRPANTLRTLQSAA